LNVGERLAGALGEIILTGRLALLERLRASRGAAASVLETVPGLGPVWVNHLRQDLGILTLEDLEAAAYDERLEHASGMGRKRLAGIRDSLSARLARVRSQAAAPAEAPTVAELLDLDREYREAAAAGRLRMIAPRRFNPARKAWLPILRTQRGERRYTVLFSNTARAHQAGRTKDWVVIYEEGPVPSGRSWTVITSRRGPLAGRRIVRGREDECVVVAGEAPVRAA
jgi:DNA polymerase (family 10)